MQTPFWFHTLLLSKTKIDQDNEPKVSEDRVTSMNWNAQKNRLLLIKKILQWTASLTLEVIEHFQMLSRQKLEIGTGVAVTSVF